MIGFDIAQVTNCQAASLFFEPAGMPQPWVATPGNRPLGPAGHIEKLQVPATLLSLAPSCPEAMFWIAMSICLSTCGYT